MDNNDQHEAEMVSKIEEFRKSFTLKMHGYSVTQHIGFQVNMVIGKFDLGGHSWAVNFSPHSGISNNIMFSVSLLTKTTTEMALGVIFSLFNYKKGQYMFQYYPSCSCKVAKRDDNVLAKYSFLKSCFETECLKGDCFLLKCFVRLVKPWYTETKNKKIVVPASNFIQSDLYQNSIHLWETGQGADVTFKVSEEVITAHRNVLVARSPVFRAQFFSPMIESRPDCIIEVQDMKPEIFKLILQFMYTDSLPLQQELSNEMAQHLLVAADRYGVERLKFICEEKLSTNLTVETAATTFVLAELHNCEQLKEICMDFVASRENLQAVMATDGYRHLLESCPIILINDLLGKLDSERRN